MFKPFIKFRYILLGMVYGIMAALPVHADDIEIYTNSGSISKSLQPNVLFVLDTSGSMGATVLIRPPYDPATNYADSGYGCFNKDRVYTLPYGSDYAWIHCHSYYSQFYGTPSSLPQVNRPAVVCSAADSLDTVGFYTGRVSQYRGIWRDNIKNNRVNKYVECEVDNGVHGVNAGSAQVWASSSNGPWSSVEADKVNWGTTGLSTTLYSGNYINYLNTVPVTSGGTRIQVMQDAITNLVNSISGVNVGLMRFDRYSNGGMVVTPIDDVDTNRTALINAVNAMTASGGTPLSESFYEAVMYYQGKSVDYGNSSSPFHSVSSSQSGGKYISPIADECQKNFIVLLTDGDPTSDYLSSSRRSKLGISTNCNYDSNGNCLDDIAKAIGTIDQSSALSGDQVISTYTVGLSIQNVLLQDTADESLAATGLGERFRADNATQLADTLNSILGDVFDTDTTFSSPAVSVNAFNRSTHLDDLYFTLFKPAASRHWDGNFKKYKLDFAVDVNDIDNDGDTTERLPFIADVNGVDAVDPVTGFFADTARSFWTDGANDGPFVGEGGAAGEMTASRNVYTYTDTYTNNSGVLSPVSSSAALTAISNKVDKTNTNITEAMLNIVGKADKIAGTPRIETLLDWAKGIDVLDQFGTSGSVTDARLVMGDPLHSEPALVQYGGTPTAPDLVAYVATNDGYLHAFDTDDGVEIFSFIPQELLPNLNDLMDNENASKTYGLDGNVVAWINDINGDGIISGSDHIYLYVTMRRGGNNIYSIDVTDRNNPELRWVIKGGTGDYTELGQTWSTINVEKIKDGTTEKTVLVFGGGYDTNQDSVTVRTADSVGRAVFIADAETGALLWSAGAGGTLPVSHMDYSIPARVKPLDLSGDGFVDRLYVADTGGQIFRFDIDNNNNSSLASSITGGRIADLADSGKKNARRFYYPPDVALIAERGQPAYLALSIASGYRAHPLNTEIQDRIYIIKDFDVYNKPTSYDTVTESDLYDATLNLVGGDGTDAQKAAAQSALDASKGWYIKLDDGTNTDTWVGEKGLSETLLLEGVAVVTTFTPSDGTGSGSCVPQAGSGRVYFLDVLDGSAAYPGDLDLRTDRYHDLARSGIPPSPNVIITEGGEPTLCVGTECGSAEAGLGLRRTFWYEVEQ